MTYRAFAIVLALFVPAATCAEEPAVVEHNLGHGTFGRLGNDGTVQLGVYAAEQWRPLLRVSWPNPRPGRGGVSPPFTAVVPGHQAPDRGGQNAGNAFFNDEPPGGCHEVGSLESGAPCSDLMGVWCGTIDERTRCVNTHHWEHPRLSGLVIMVFSQDTSDVVEDLHLSLAMPGYWVSAGEICPTPPGKPDFPLFLAHLADPRPGEPPLWVGAALLDRQPRRHSGVRIRIERSDLHVPVIDASQDMALAIAPTRLRVMEDLAAAVDFQQGIVDPESGRIVRWLLAVEDGELDEDLMPAAALRRESRDRFSLVFRVDEKQHRFFDPDLFSLDGQGLGHAERLGWVDERGRRATIEWSGAAVFRGGPCRPYEALDAHGAGTLEFLFPGPLPTGLEDSYGAFELGAVLIDGRRGSCTLDWGARQKPGHPEEEHRESDDNRHPQLLPSLLVSSPNPFHTTTRISFQIPGTFGEAFAPEEGRKLGFDLQRRMPYADGVANVQVTVYNLEGRELATLFAGLAGEGTYETAWDGRDREGRALASGTYVCRLQIERWSVTRRLIYIR